MNKQEKKVIYQNFNTYSTLYKRTDQTKNVWLVCHGLGYLSRYFISYFKSLDPAENYVIAPQAPSKYYQNSDFKYVGASWLTKENTRLEMQNILQYLDAVYDAEEIKEDTNLIIFGFSQGVSVSMRWMVSRKIQPKMLVIYAGRIPQELTRADFDYLKPTKIKLIYGKDDPYINEKVLTKQRKFAEELFGNKGFEGVAFDGKHQVKSEIINRLSKDLKN